MTVDERQGVRVTVAVDVRPGNSEYFMLMCIRDVVGCSHVQFGGVTAHLVIEGISRAIRVAFDSLAEREPSR